MVFQLSGENTMYLLCSAGTLAIHMEKSKTAPYLVTQAKVTPSYEWFRKKTMISEEAKDPACTT